MRTREAAFSTVELIVAVAITLMLLAAGGSWLRAMQPGALRGAVDNVQADLVAARAIAASGGNGATLVFAPQAGTAPGFTLRVYSGRPHALGAVTRATTMPVSSVTSLSEVHFGKPPFALFLSSAGYATGLANYPSLDAQENPAFAPIAQQPACPPGGIVLTFTSPQGATATLTLPCRTGVSGVAAPGVTPTPNVPHVSPTYLLAHDTTDAAPLTFKVAEYGYYHWYASANNAAACQTIASDTGAAPAVFASPWPYAAPSPAAQGAAAPAPPPFAPYTWPAGDPNDPPARFALAPVRHDGGMCIVAVQDDYGQGGTVTVQVMGDLTASQANLTLTVGQSAQTVAFTKTFDSEKLLLSTGGPCIGIVTATTASGTYPASPSKATANASVTVTPVGPGTCTLTVQDQYGERVTLGVTVTQAMASWPEQLTMSAGNVQIASRRPPFDLGGLLNGLLGGGTANAVTAGCYAAAYTIAGAPDPLSSLPSFVQTFANANGIYTDATGCFTNASYAPIAATNNTVGMIAYEPNQVTKTYVINGAQNTCNGTNASEGGWFPGSSGSAAVLLLQPGATAGTCQVAVTDGPTTPSIDHGLTSVSVFGELTWTSVSHGCTSVDQGNGSILITCSGVASAMYGGLTTCGASQFVDTKNVSGNGGGAGSAIAAGSGTAPLSPL
ncbi:MAG TPA: hypothetical protein VIK27_03670, partial [Candidatus Aquilonibacter sp.]